MADSDQIAQWVEAAMEEAGVSHLSDGHFALVDPCKGAWGYGNTRQDALVELEEVLADWVWLKLEHGDDDIPVMGGVDFYE